MIDNQMQVEKHERKTIKHAKAAELGKARDELFADLDEVNELDSKLLQQGRDENTSARTLEQRKKDVLDEMHALDKAEEKRKNYGKTRGEDIFTAEDVQRLDGDENVTKYKADEQIGQCTVEEVEDEAVEEEPTIEEVAPTESAPPEKPAELPEIRQKKE